MSVRRLIRFVVLPALPIITLASCSRPPAEDVTTDTTVPAAGRSTDASIETSVQARVCTPGAQCATITSMSARQTAS